MPVDEAFTNPRLAATYDVAEGERDDLDAYEAIVDEFGARSVLDIGCGTGELACRLARRGIEVAGVDPAAASIDIARAKDGANLVTWHIADGASVPPVGVDLATMTANVAQVFVTDEEWRAVLAATHRALRPGGHLVFETRDPARRAWEGWTREATHEHLALPDGESVETWCDVTGADGELVSFRWTNVFESDGASIVSDSTLRFRDREQVERSLADAGFDVVDVREAPDRPALEMVFIARRP
ncbi:MAG: class I SAM-dependent DNA methyltransferase [Ilumatobacteraceae bacterium]